MICYLIDKNYTLMRNVECFLRIALDHLPQVITVISQRFYQNDM